MVKFVVVSGCSSGGKSTLLAEMSRLGFQTVPEPGRQIVKDQLETGGDALPWVNAARFLDLCIARGIAAYSAAPRDGRVVLFDRSIVDAVSAVRGITHSLRQEHRDALERYRYARRVYMAPPWRELFENDAERRHGFDEAVNEYERLMRDYREWGYEVEVLPKLPLAERVEHLRCRLREVTDAA